MTTAQISLSLLLVVTLVLFIWGRIRQDLVALIALLAATLMALVPTERVWDGLSHPAVVTVAAILVLSSALATAGVVDWAARPLERLTKQPLLLLIGLSGTVALLSGFINNVGALALMMPVAIRLARDAGKPVSMYLMPLAFASLLGGMTTLIGTPPNLIVSGFREKAGLPPFAMFDFAWVGAPIAIAGVVYLSTIGWRLVPRRPASVDSAELTRIGPYLTEATVTARSSVVNTRVGDALPEDVQLLSVVRGDRRFASPSQYLALIEGDVLVMIGTGEVIEKFTKEALLEVVKPTSEADSTESSDSSPKERDASLAESKDVGLVEAVVKPSAWIVGRSAQSLRLRDRFSVNLIALAREGSRREPRLSDTRFRAGDVLLLQGARESLPLVIADLGCLPLAERGIGIGQADRRWPALGIFLAAILAVTLGGFDAPVAFLSAAVVMTLARIITVRQAYEAVDWPVLMLLAAMIPLGVAIETTGLAAIVASGALSVSTIAPAWAMVAILLIATMFLSDLVNNAAAAVMMCPIALGVAKGIEASPDPFLIAVAIGASCAFLTPVGHQSNLLVMGPGGYRFGDYWRVGLPLEALVALVSVPAIVYFWPPL